MKKKIPHSIKHVRYHSVHRNNETSSLRQPSNNWRGDAIAFVAMKAFGERFGIPMNVNGAIMFAIAIFLGNLVVNYLQRAKWVKEDL